MSSESTTTAHAKANCEQCRSGVPCPGYGTRSNCPPLIVLAVIALAQIIPLALHAAPSLPAGAR